MNLELSDDQYKAICELILLGFFSKNQKTSKYYNNLIDRIPESMLNEAKSYINLNNIDFHKKFNYNYLSIKENDSLDVVLDKIKIFDIIYNSYSFKYFITSQLAKYNFIDKVAEEVFYKKQEYSCNIRKAVLEVMKTRGLKLNKELVIKYSKNLKNGSDKQLFIQIIETNTELLSNIEAMSKAQKFNPFWVSIMADKSILPFLVTKKSDYYNSIEIRLSEHKENFKTFKDGSEFILKKYYENKKKKK